MSADLHVGFHKSRHPVLAHKLTALRDKSTSPRVFRQLLREITFYLGYEATAHIAVRDVAVESAQGTVRGVQISDRVAVVPIMRAGLSMVDTMLELVPHASVHHIGMYRDPRALVPLLYYNKLPAECKADIAFVLCPVIATAGTINATVKIIKEWGCTNIVVMTVVASRAGVDNLLETHPDIRIFLGDVDEELTKSGELVPGLGDIGDRLFNTTPSPDEQLEEEAEEASAGAGAAAAASPAKRRRADE